MCCHPSIDPPGCTDVDDALHVRRLPPSEATLFAASHPSGSAFGNTKHTIRGSGGPFVEVGVHIADVTYFVRPGSLLDGEARDRCTSVYLVDRLVYMVWMDL